MGILRSLFQHLPLNLRLNEKIIPINEQLRNSEYSRIFNKFSGSDWDHINVLQRRDSLRLFIM
jgi:hypothetical protein